MENRENQDIDRYLRAEMSADERLNFEAQIAADPALQQAVEEMRLLVDGIRFTAQRDIRRRAEAARERYGQATILRKTRFQMGMAASILVLFGLLLGYLIFPNTKEALSVPNKSDSDIPVALTEHEVIFSGEISSINTEKSTSFSVALNPNLQKPEYAFHGLDGGICFYVRLEDDFWKKQPLKIMEENGQFFLKIGEQKILLLEDGKHHTLTFK